MYLQILSCIIVLSEAITGSCALRAKRKTLPWQVVNNQCPRQFSTAGCPKGRYCIMQMFSLWCVRQGAVGTSCHRGVQCLSGLCQDRKCAAKCTAPLTVANCPANSFCEEGHSGNSCVKKYKIGTPCVNTVQCLQYCVNGKCSNNQCPEPGTATGCPKNHYCKYSGTHNICTRQAGDGTPCRYDEECLNYCKRGRCDKNECPKPLAHYACPVHHFCKFLSSGNRCVQQLSDGQKCSKDVECINNCMDSTCTKDECPTPNCTDGCPAGHYCNAGGQGNRCVRQLSDGQKCSKDAECINNCMDGTCIRDQCPTPSSTDDCPAGHYCNAGGHGNRCVRQLSDGHLCSKDAECINNCIDGTCMSNECPTPSSTDGCPDGFYCIARMRLNICVMQLGEGHHCSKSIECINSCSGGFCTDMHG